MMRLSVSALRWRDAAQACLRSLVAAARGASGAQALRSLQATLAQALGRPTEAVWLTGAGRTALHAIVQATRRGPQDEALLPGYTCVVVPHVFTHLGHAVRYVDVAPGGLNPALADWLAAVGPHTRWAVVPHNFGLASEGVVAALRQRHPQLLVIEDAAHAWGASAADGQLLGTAGHAAFFSFEYSKCLSTGLGGALLVNEPALRPAVAEVLAADQPPTARSTVKQGLTLVYHLALATWPAPLAAGLTALLRVPARALGVVAGTQASELSGARPPDYRQALSPWGAQLALPQLARMPAVLALRREQAWRYAQLLAGSPWLHGWVPPAATPTQAPTLLRFPVAVRHPSQRPALCAGLRALGIEPGEWFDDVVHPAGSQGHGYTPGDCPRGEWLAKTLVNLPLGLHAQWTASQWAGLRRLAQQAPAEGVADVGAGPMAGGPGP